MKYKQNTFIERLQQIFGDKYDYSKIVYKNYQTKICLICHTHGEFWKTPHELIKGKGCPKCAKELSHKKKAFSYDEILTKCIKTHGNTYSYYTEKESGFKTYSDKIKIHCHKHGDFFQTPLKHILGQCCPKCQYEKNGIKSQTTLEEIKEKAKEKYGDKLLILGKFVDKHNKTMVDAKCSLHGEYKTYVSTLFKGNGGCPYCFYDNLREKKSLTKDEFIKKSKEIFQDNFSYNKVEFKNTKTKIKLICNKCGNEFDVLPYNHLYNQSGCPHCPNTKSRWENEVFDFIKSLGVEAIQNDREHLKGKQEIDIFIPKLNIGFECNGLYFHSSKFKTKNYHINKTNNAMKNGIQLYQIFEDEWENKKDIVKSLIQYKCKLIQNKISAHKCQIQEIDENSKNIFYEENSIFGNIKSIFNYGLMYNNELLMIMSLDEKNNVHVVSKKYTLVHGGFLKLLNFSIREHKLKNIISNCDRRWFDGHTFSLFNFNLKKQTKPNVFYVNTLKRSVEKFDTAKYEIYDCGDKIFKLNKKRSI